MNSPNLYNNLGLNEGASTEDIKKAYRKIAKECHPDINPNNPQAEEKFKNAAEAYETLGDVIRKTKYDKTLRPKDTYRNEYGDVEFNFNDEYFKGFGGFYQFFDGYVEKGTDVHVTVALTLEELMSNSIKEIVLTQERLKINIPAGVPDGFETIVKEKGGPATSPNYPRGDLIIKIKELPHKYFTRVGNTIHYKLYLGYPDIILGASVDIPHLGGILKVNVPKGLNIGSKLRLNGKGIAGEHMEVEINLYIPKTLSKEELELIHKLSYCPNIRPYITK